VLQARLNLGILAHVDAGKTTLTERLLFDAGLVDVPGSVDRGTTQTDTLALERERGITIRAAVVAFPLDDVLVNLIDTPGHPDFIAEVERALGVLDGVVLVVSAVEGVQAQTPVLWRALRRLAIPTVVFVNKLDRRGADPERVLEELWTRLSLEIEPVYGSALTGEGIPELRAAIARLPRAGGDPGAPVDAAVFKIERGPHGEKIAYARVFDGTISVRDRFADAKVTALEVFDGGRAVRARSASAGEIARLWGLHSVRIGDRLGAGGAATSPQFPPPTLEAVVEPLDPRDGERLKTALELLAEQDPLISVRQTDELSVSIYGEVQKEVLEATLARDHGVAVRFRATRPICVERVVGVGEAVELLKAPTNRFHAQVGLRVEPAADDTGVTFRLDVPHDRLPLYVYKRREAFEEAMRAYVEEALRGGPHGWRVTDCTVTMVDCWYSLADGPPSRRGPMPTAADFHGLTPLVLARALARAGTVVCEPILHVRLDVPAASLGATMAAASRLHAELEPPRSEGEVVVVEGLLPAALVDELQRQLPALTRGEGVLESSFGGYRPAVSAVPGGPSSEARNRSASSAAMQPEPAAVIACR
jgi:ribosomal protection tetracycline resistance protein